MSGVMALRTQILDNLKMLDYPRLDGGQFVLLWDGDYWTVFLDQSDSAHYVFSYDYFGKGATIEAYTDMLKSTARELHLRYQEEKALEAMYAQAIKYHSYE